MAANFTIEERIERPPAEVYAALTDIDAWSSYIPEILRIERLSEGPLAVGSRWRETRRMYGREASEVFEATALEPARAIGMRCDGSEGSMGSGVFECRYTLEPVDANATLLRLDGTMTMPGCLFAVMAIFMKSMMVKAIRRDLAALRAYVEAGAPPGA